ncbi:PrpF domain-containing protein [Amycolatopsis sp. CA-230715]|uniref:PrpF domain-containing protein n=1 Tax=Amycolatopsis sp. CA-230715 TaxID=2745196 RepID=UPI001C320E87|nr:PrpF domain-containing protein [Amycolatopsis sp. CA-230715]QWF76980.1 3-methylitaconate isomerase [Amycolatopsis sp. CA-230715]
MHVPATLVRGGTSKCWLFDAADVPSDLDELERLLISAYGAADPVQLDGVGGATPTTSKAAVVRRADTGSVDVDYLFCQVGIGVERVEWGSNCGNCATAIGLWAVTRGLVPITGDRTRVVLRNTNTGAVLEAEVDTTGGIAHEFGTATVPGTRSGGVAVGLTFVDPVHSVPSPRTELVVDDRAVPVTLLDAGAPMALVDAARTGRDAAASIAAVRREVGWLRSVRRAAAPLMGLSPEADAVPKVGLVGSPVAYRSTTGERIGAADYDVSVRMLTMTEPHPTIGLTSATGIGVANLVPGSVVHARSTEPGGEVLRIGTPAGVVAVTCADLDGSVPRRVTVRRAARVLCEASISVAEPLSA